jgi:RHS repeat-associated protein
MQKVSLTHTYPIISVLKKSAYDEVRKFEVPYYGKDNDDYVNGQGFCCEDAPQNAPARAPSANDNPELFQYYYHSDHLGSTSLITNLDGEVVQHIEYVPFGEVFIEERNNTWNTPYLFNAKELDEETGLYYYGARYYEPRVSVWYGADPMQEKYPGVSTYAYCNNNPVRYIDPTGNTPEERLAAITLIRTYIGTPYSKMDCSETVDRAIRNGTDLGSFKRGKGINGWTNGVALIVSNSRPVEIDDIETGNVVTFRSTRSDHKGNDGEYDHIGMITNVVRNEDGSVNSFDFIHASSSKGVIEQSYNVNEGLSWLKLKGTFAWDTPEEKIYSGGQLPEVVVIGQNITVKPTIQPLTVSNVKLPEKISLPVVE